MGGSEERLQRGRQGRQAGDGSSRDQLQSTYDRITSLKDPAGARAASANRPFVGLGCARGVQPTNARETMKDLLAPDDTRDALRKYRRAAASALGMLMLVIPQGLTTGAISSSSSFYAVPAAFLYGEGVFTDKFTGGVRAVAGRLQRLRPDLRAVRAGPVRRAARTATSSAARTSFWIFGVTAGLAFYAGAVKGIRFQLLAGSIAMIISWSALWDEILGDEGIARQLRRLPRPAGDPRDPPAGRRAVPVAQRRRRPRHRHRRQRRRRPGPVEGVGADHRRRHLGRARVQPRHQLGRELHRPVRRRRVHRRSRPRPSLGHPAAADLARA